VDSTVGCSLLSFLGCYSGYHQIPLKKEGQIKTSFIIPFGAFCYTTMPFGHKSAGETYQGGIVTEPPRGGVCRQDQLEPFSAKQEHNQHT
jgi:hypothetical protein